MNEIVIPDRVLMLWTGTGSGNITPDAAVSGYRTASAVLSAGVRFPYAAFNPDVPTEWENGIGYLSGSAIVRAPIASSNGNDLVNFSAGNKQIAINRHSAIVGFNRCLWGSGALGNLTVSGANVTTLTEDSYYLKVDFEAATTGHINCNGYRLFCLDELDLRNCPAGGIRASTTANGTLGGGRRLFVSELVAILGGATGPTFEINSIPWGTSLVGIPGGYGETGAFGGGVLEIAARRIRRDATTTAAAIRALGADDAGADDAGSGGRVRIAYQELLGTLKAAAISCAGGSSSSGAGGHGGVVETFDMSAGTNAFTRGAANSGATGGACSVDL